MNLAQTNPPLTPPRRGTGQLVPLPSREGLGVGSWSQCMRVSGRGLSMNLGCVGQTFLSAGSGDFPVARSRNTRQECPVERSST